MSEQGDDLGIESLFEDVGACGWFQVLIVCLLFLAETPAAFSMVFMSFGNYNPGWRCLDNQTLTNDTSWQSDDCAIFESCQNVQFKPESSTVITEWGLVCDRVWISSAIISLQMAGMLVGAYISGYLGDKIGRKRTFTMAVSMIAVVNFIAYFSFSWQMYAVMRFLIGVLHATFVSIPFIICSEYSSSKWRSFISSLPTWPVGAILFASCAMITKDWRLVQLVAALLTAAFFLPSIWVPESLRWMTLKNKKERVRSVTKTMATLNGKPHLDTKDFEVFWGKSQTRSLGKSREYSWRDLWKRQVYKRTLIFTINWFTISLVYFVLSFGVKSLSGNFYTNLMIFYALDFPAFFTSCYTPNLLGRKAATLAHSVVATISLFVILGFDRLADPEVKGLGILVVIMVTKIAVSGQWYILQLFMAESYPTVIRSTCIGFGFATARIGGVVAPYLIPNNPDTYYISYSIMAVLTLLCSFLVLLLPETKGTQLKDTWDTTEALTHVNGEDQSETHLREDYADKTENPLHIMRR